MGFRFKDIKKIKVSNAFLLLVVEINSLESRLSRLEINSDFRDTSTDRLSGLVQTIL